MQERPTWRIWIVLYLAMAVQTTWFAHWRPFGAHIDLPLMTTISVGLLLGWEMGATYGLIAGLLMGYYTDFNVGSFAVSRAVVGGVCGLFESRFSRDNPFAPPLCAIGGVVLSNLVFLVMSPTEFPVVWWVQHTIAPALMQALLIWPLHAVISYLVPAATGSWSAPRGDPNVVTRGR